MTLNELTVDSHNRAVRKGWWDKNEDPTERILEKLALVHSEVSEAVECYRNGEMDTQVQFGTRKPTGFGTELADVIIRVADLAGALGIDLEEEILRKTAYNETRLHRHGGKLA